MKTDTAHLAWNDRWSTPHGRAEWLTPEPDVAAFAAQLATGFAKRVLDHGCGVARHALAYARHGLDVPAVLLSGHHGEIERWRRQQALRRTYDRRPDLLADEALTDEERQWLAAWRAGERNGAET